MKRAALLFAVSALHCRWQRSRKPLRAPSRWSSLHAGQRQR
jgi:hypothetical protein